MAPGSDADNCTAAEHYIFGRLLRNNGGALGAANALTGSLWSGWYCTAKETGAWEKLTGRKTSPASSNQKEWGDSAWWDSFIDNHDKRIKIKPGDDCGC